MANISHPDSSSRSLIRTQTLNENWCELNGPWHNTFHLRAHLENPIYSNVNNKYHLAINPLTEKNWVYWFSASVRKMCLLQKWYFAILTFYSSLLPLHFTSSSLSSAAYNDKLLEAFNLWLRRLHRFSKPFESISASKRATESCSYRTSQCNNDGMMVAQVSGRVESEGSW